MVWGIKVNIFGPNADSVWEWNMMECLSWFGAAFLPVVLAVLFDLMGSWMLKSVHLI